MTPACSKDSASLIQPCMTLVCSSDYSPACSSGFLFMTSAPSFIVLLSTLWLIFPCMTLAAIPTMLLQSDPASLTLLLPPVSPCLWSPPWSCYDCRDNRVPAVSPADSYPVVCTTSSFQHINLNGTTASLSLASPVLTFQWCLPLCHKGSPLIILPLTSCVTT